MSVVYLEDVVNVKNVKKISNKFLVVNIIAKRGRQLNEESSPFLSQDDRKASSLAIEEFVEGKIGYNQLGKSSEPSDDLHLFSVDESEEAEKLEDLQPDETYVDDSKSRELDEPEEGL